MCGHPAVHKQLRQAEEDIIRAPPSGHLNGQTLPRVLIHDREQLDRPTILRPQRHDVVGPHMIRLLRSQADTGAIRQPEAPAWRLALRHLESFPPPDPFHAFVIHAPAVVVQQGGDSSIPVSPILARQLDDRRRQRELIIRRIGLIPLRRAGLAQHPTGPAFRDAQRVAAVRDSLPAARWA